MKAISDRDKILSFHPRKQHNFEQASILSELYPERFKHVTSIYFGPSLVLFLSRLSPKLARQMGKRSYPALPKKYVISLPSVEIKKWLLERKKGPAHLSDFMDLNELWQKKILKRFNPPGVCISYDGISHLLFREWKDKSKLMLDLAIGLPQYRIKIMHGDRFHTGLLEEVDTVQKELFARYTEEIKLADIILCGSEFVKKTVVYFFPEFETKCKLLPYGTDLAKFSYPERTFEKTENLKFAFVGRLSWRKGADLMLNAWKDFVTDHPLAELHFFGTPDQEISLGKLPGNTFIHGWMAKPELISYLKTVDVFVFPTTFEGSSTAVFQAMALKLPVITTVNSGTVLTHGESCEIVEVGDQAGLVNAMNKLFHDPEYRQQLAEKAFTLSKQYTWNDYKQKLGIIMEEVFAV